MKTSTFADWRPDIAAFLVTGMALIAAASSAIGPDQHSYELIGAWQSSQPACERWDGPGVGRRAIRAACEP